MKKILYILCAVALIGMVGFRIYSIYSESRREVFNAARVEALPVETMIAREQSGTLREPLFIKNNRALVSGSRVRKFGVGQKIGDGHIIGMSNKLDLDTGMYVIKTAGAADGEQFVESKYTGFFIPIYAVKNDSVMVNENGVATVRPVKIINQDSENVLIQRGLSEGDAVILSKVEEGTLVTSSTGFNK
jgi:hypothetical protein